MKRAFVALALAVGFLLFGGIASAQTADTNCTTIGDSTHCTSTITDPAANAEAMRQAGQDMGNALGTAVNAIRRRRANKRAQKNAEAGVQAAEVSRFTFCQQHPTESGCEQEGLEVRATCTLGRDKSWRDVCRAVGLRWKAPNPVPTP